MSAAGTAAGAAAGTATGKAAGMSATETATAGDVAGWAVMTLDDVEEGLRVDVGVTLTGGVGLLEPGARLAMTRWRRSAIRPETDALLTEGAMLSRDLCRC